MKITPVSTKIKRYPIGTLRIVKGYTSSGEEITELTEFIRDKITARAHIIKGKGSVLEHFNDNGKIIRRFINKSN